MKNAETVKKHIEMLKCNNPYRIRGSHFHKITPLISHEIWEMENLLMNGDSLENFLKDYCWQNALIINGLSKQAAIVLRTFFGRLKAEFNKFEKNKLEKLKKETEELGKKWFYTNWKACEIKHEMQMRSDVNQIGKIVSFLDSSCDGRKFFEILKEFYEKRIDKDKALGRVKDEDIAGWYDATNTGKLADFRNVLAHTNEIQLALNVEALVYSFNDAKYLLRYLKFIQGEGWFPVFLEYEFKLLND